MMLEKIVQSPVNLPDVYSSYESKRACRHRYLNGESALFLKYHSFFLTLSLLKPVYRFTANLN